MEVSSEELMPIPRCWFCLLGWWVSLAKRKSLSAGPSPQVHQICGKFLLSPVKLVLAMWHNVKGSIKNELFSLETFTGSVDLPFTIYILRERSMDHIVAALAIVRSVLESVNPYKSLLLYLCIVVGKIGIALH